MPQIQILFRILLLLPLMNTNTYTNTQLKLMPGTYKSFSSDPVVNHQIRNSLLIGSILYFEKEHAGGFGEKEHISVTNIYPSSWPILEDPLSTYSSFLHGAAASSKRVSPIFITQIIWEKNISVLSTKQEVKNTKGVCRIRIRFQGGFLWTEFYNRCSQSINVFLGPTSLVLV